MTGIRLVALRHFYRKLIWYTIYQLHKMRNILRGKAPYHC